MNRRDFLTKSILFSGFSWNLLNKNLFKSGVNEMKINIIYFSATSNTKKIKNVIKNELKERNVICDELDITSYQNRQSPIDLKPYDAVIFGFPVHARRSPKIAREWLKTLNGNNMRCATFFTYGGFGAYPAHGNLKKVLEERNFVVVASAEFLGAHAFNYGGFNALPDRPNSHDFKVAQEFAHIIKDRFSNNVLKKISDFEKGKWTEEQIDAFQNHRYKTVSQLPTRNGKTCSLCKTCEDECPTKAMDSISGNTDKTKCIVCLRCVANCPDNALHINDLSMKWENKLAVEGISESTLQKKESKIYL
jgi:flavodoxin/ferredoxin